MNSIANKIQSESSDQITIIVDGTEIKQFSSLSALFSIDKVGTGFSFVSPFFPGTKEYRDLFRPFEYQEFQLYIGNDLKLNGYFELPVPGFDAEKNIVTVQGRSKTGVLVDCDFENGDKMEFTNAGLEEIANSVISPFGLTSVFNDSPGAIFEKAGAASPMTKRFDFLQNLARQRSLLMNQTPEGNLLFEKAKTTGTPVAELIEGQQGIILSSPSYNGTERFSDYNVYGQEPGKNDNFALLNDSSIPIKRPKSIHANDTNQGNIDQVARWQLTSDIANAINIPIGYEGFLRPDGKLWEKNELISVHAPSLMIYKPFVFLIKEVLFTQGSESNTTRLSLSLPDAYSNKVPEVFPWSE